MSAAEAYAREVHEQVARYATWLPTDHIKVGSVGRLRRDIFYPEAHLSDFGISFNVVKDPDAKATYKFMSSGAREAVGSVSASGVPASAGTASATLTIGFGKEHSVYFLLTQCVGSAIDNLVRLGGEILKRVRRKEWELDYVVVTRLVTAGSATILQANSKNASVVLEGSATATPVLELLKSGASVTVKSQTSVGISVVAESRLTPLLSLGKVHYNFIDWVLGEEPKFSPYAAARNSIGVKLFNSLVDSTPNVELASGVDTKNDVGLEVRLPKYGDYVDIGDLLDLTAGALKVRTGTALQKHAKVQEPRVARPSRADIWNPRVDKARFVSLVKKLPRVDLDLTHRAEDHMKLRVKLPKSGAVVNVAPLITLTTTTAQPRPKATASTELSFDEIA